jgi:hypothetical protein
MSEQDKNDYLLWRESCLRPDTGAVDHLNTRVSSAIVESKAINWNMYTWGPLFLEHILLRMRPVPELNNDMKKRVLSPL